ncbi:MAG: glucoamylase family protein, partial [Candidatus Omnitrophica bacterium]|nr:glucoamylase family protein [Candidatus Omnitrophota bacterium]
QQVAGAGAPPEKPSMAQVPFLPQTAVQGGLNLMSVPPEKTPAEAPSKAAEIVPVADLNPGTYIYRFQDKDGTYISREYDPRGDGLWNIYEFAENPNGPGTRGRLIEVRGGVVIEPGKESPTSGETFKDPGTVIITVGYHDKEANDNMNKLLGVSGVEYRAWECLDIDMNTIPGLSDKTKADMTASRGKAVISSATDTDIVLTRKLSSEPYKGYVKKSEIWVRKDGRSVTEEYTYIGKNGRAVLSYWTVITKPGRVFAAREFYDNGQIKCEEEWVSPGLNDDKTALRGTFGKDMYLAARKYYDEAGKEIKTEKEKAPVAAAVTTEKAAPAPVRAPVLPAKHPAVVKHKAVVKLAEKPVEAVKPEIAKPHIGGGAAMGPGAVGAGPGAGTPPPTKKTEKPVIAAVPETKPAATVAKKPLKEEARPQETPVTAEGSEEAAARAKRIAEYEKEFALYAQYFAAKDFDKAVAHLNNCVDIVTDFISEGEKGWAKVPEQLNKEYSNIAEAYKAAYPADYQRLLRIYNENVEYLTKRGEEYIAADKAGDFEKARLITFNSMTSIQYLISAGALIINPNLRTLLKDWKNLSEIQRDKDVAASSPTERIKRMAKAAAEMSAPFTAPQKTSLDYFVELMKAQRLERYLREYRAYSALLKANDHEQAYGRLENCITIIDEIVKDGGDEWAGPLGQLKNMRPEEKKIAAAKAEKEAAAKEAAIKEAAAKKPAVVPEPVKEQPKAAVPQPVKEQPKVTAAPQKISITERWGHRFEVTSDGSKLNVYVMDPATGKLDKWIGSHTGFTRAADGTITNYGSLYESAGYKKEYIDGKPVNVMYRQFAYNDSVEPEWRGKTIVVSESDPTVILRTLADGDIVTIDEGKVYRTADYRDLAGDISATAEAIEPDVIEFLKKNKAPVREESVKKLSKFFATYGVSHAKLLPELKTYIQLLSLQRAPIDAFRDEVTKTEGEKSEELQFANPWIQHITILPLKEMEAIEKILVECGMTPEDLGLYSFFANLRLNAVNFRQEITGNVPISLRGATKHMLAITSDMDAFTRRWLDRMKRSAAILSEYYKRPMNFNDPFDLGLIVQGEVNLPGNLFTTEDTSQDNRSFIDKVWAMAVEDRFFIDYVEMEGVIDDRIEYEIINGPGTYWRASEEERSKSFITPAAKERLERLFSAEELSALQQKYRGFHIVKPQSMMDAMTLICVKLYGKDLNLGENDDKAVILSWFRSAYIKELGADPLKKLEDLKKQVDIMVEIKDVVVGRYGVVTELDIKKEKLSGHKEFLEARLRAPGLTFADREMASALLKKEIETKKEIIEYGRLSYWAQFVQRYSADIKRLGMTAPQFLSAIFKAENAIRTTSGVKGLMENEKTAEGRRMAIALDLLIYDKLSGWADYFNTDGTIKGKTKAEQDANRKHIDDIFEIAVKLGEQKIRVLEGRDKFAEGRRMGIAMAMVKGAIDAAKGMNPSDWVNYFNADGSVKDDAARTNVTSIFAIAEKLGEQNVESLSGDAILIEGRRVGIAMALVQEGMSMRNRSGRLYKYHSDWSVYIRRDGEKLTISDESKEDINDIFRLVEDKKALSDEAVKMYTRKKTLADITIGDRTNVAMRLVKGFRTMREKRKETPQKPQPAEPQKIQPPAKQAPAGKVSLAVPPIYALFMANLFGAQPGAEAPVVEPKDYPVWGLSPATNPDNAREYLELGALSGANRGGGYESSKPVITPHASFLALDVAPQEAMRNIKEMVKRYPGLVGRYGLKDSVNVKTGTVSEAYLALDQSMSFIAAANYLTDGAVQKAFASSATVKPALKLLDEKFDKLSAPSGLSLETKLSEEDRKQLTELARLTWQYFNPTVVTKETNWLPPDRITTADGTAGYTSITNIGLYLMSITAAEKLGFITNDEAKTRVSKVLAVLAELDKWNGLFRNYYRTANLLSVSAKDKFISSVDNGWLAAGLIVAAESYPDLKKEAQTFVDNMEFERLYDRSAGKLRNGYDEKKGPTSSHYGLIYTEIRPTLLIAIGKGDVQARVWKNTSKTLPAGWNWQAQRPEGDYYKYTATINGKKETIYFIPSWGGSMFEGLMPNLVLDNKKFSPQGYALQDAVYLFRQKYFATGEITAQPAVPAVTVPKAEPQAKPITPFETMPPAPSAEPAKPKAVTPQAEPAAPPARVFPAKVAPVPVVKQPISAADKAKFAENSEEYFANLNWLEKYFPTDTQDEIDILNGTQGAMADDLMNDPSIWAPIFMSAKGKLDTPEQKKNAEALFKGLSPKVTAEKDKGIYRNVRDAIDPMLKGKTGQEILPGYEEVGAVEGTEIWIAKDLYEKRSMGLVSDWEENFKPDGTVRDASQPAILKELFRKAGALILAMGKVPMPSADKAGIAMNVARDKEEKGLTQWIKDGLINDNKDGTYSLSDKGNLVLKVYQDLTPIDDYLTGTKDKKSGTKMAIARDVVVHSDVWAGIIGVDPQTKITTINNAKVSKLFAITEAMKLSKVNELQGDSPEAEGIRVSLARDAMTNPGEWEGLISIDAKGNVTLGEQKLRNIFAVELVLRGCGIDRLTGNTLEAIGRRMAIAKDTVLQPAIWSDIITVRDGRANIVGDNLKNLYAVERKMAASAVSELQGDSPKVEGIRVSLARDAIANAGEWGNIISVDANGNVTLDEQKLKNIFALEAELKNAGIDKLAGNTLDAIGRRMAIAKDAVLKPEIWSGVIGTDGLKKIYAIEGRMAGSTVKELRGTSSNVEGVRISLARDAIANPGEWEGLISIDDAGNVTLDEQKLKDIFAVEFELRSCGIERLTANNLEAIGRRMAIAKDAVLKPEIWSKMIVVQGAKARILGDSLKRLYAIERKMAVSTVKNLRGDSPNVEGIRVSLARDAIANPGEWEGLISIDDKGTVTLDENRLKEIFALELKLSGSGIGKLSGNTLEAIGRRMAVAKDMVLKPEIWSKISDDRLKKIYDIELKMSGSAVSRLQGDSPNVEGVRVSLARDAMANPGEWEGIISIDAAGNVTLDEKKLKDIFAVEFALRDCGIERLIGSTLDVIGRRMAIAKDVVLKPEIWSKIITVKDGTVTMVGDTLKRLYAVERKMAASDVKELQGESPNVEGTRVSLARDAVANPGDWGSIIEVFVDGKGNVSKVGLDENKLTLMFKVEKALADKSGIDKLTEKSLVAKGRRMAIAKNVVARIDDWQGVINIDKGEVILNAAKLKLIFGIENRLAGVGVKKLEGDVPSAEGRRISIARDVVIRPVRWKGIIDVNAKGEININAATVAKIFAVENALATAPETSGIAKLRGDLPEIEGRRMSLAIEAVMESISPGAKKRWKGVIEVDDKLKVTLDKERLETIFAGEKALADSRIESFTDSNKEPVSKTEGRRMAVSEYATTKEELLKPIGDGLFYMNSKGQIIPNVKLFTRAGAVNDALMNSRVAALKGDDPDTEGLRMAYGVDAAAHPDEWKGLIEITEKPDGTIAVKLFEDNIEKMLATDEALKGFEGLSKDDDYTKGTRAAFARGAVQRPNDWTGMIDFDKDGKPVIGKEQKENLKKLFDIAKNINEENIPYFTITEEDKASDAAMRIKTGRQIAVARDLLRNKADSAWSDYLDYNTGKAVNAAAKDKIADIVRIAENLKEQKVAKLALKNDLVAEGRRMGIAMDLVAKADKSDWAVYLDFKTGDIKGPKKDLNRGYVTEIFDISDRFTDDNIAALTKINKDDVTEGHKTAIAMGLVKLLAEKLNNDRKLMDKILAYRLAVAAAIEKVDINNDLYKAELDLYKTTEKAVREKRFARALTAEEKTLIDKKCDAEFPVIYRYGYIAAFADDLHLDRNYKPLDKAIPAGRIGTLLKLRALVDKLVNERIVAVGHKGPDFEMEINDHFMPERRKEVSERLKERGVVGEKADRIVDAYLNSVKSAADLIYRQGVVNSRAKVLLEKLYRPVEEKTGKKAGTAEDEAAGMLCAAEKILRAERFVDDLAKSYWRPLNAGEVWNWAQVFLGRRYLSAEERKLPDDLKEERMRKYLVDPQDLPEWQASSGKIAETYRDIANLFSLINIEQTGQTHAVDNVKDWVESSRGFGTEESFAKLLGTLKEAGLMDAALEDVVARIYDPKFKMWQNLRPAIERLDDAKSAFLRKKDSEDRSAALKGILTQVDNFISEYTSQRDALVGKARAEKDGAKKKALEALAASYAADIKDLTGLKNKVSDKDVEEFAKVSPQEPADESNDKVDALLKKTDDINAIFNDTRDEELTLRDSFFKLIAADVKVPAFMRKVYKENAKAAERVFGKNFIARAIARLNLSADEEAEALKRDKAVAERLRQEIFAARLDYNLDSLREKRGDELATSDAQLIMEAMDKKAKEKGKTKEAMLEDVKNTILDRLMNGAYLRSVYKSNGLELETGELGFLQAEIRLNTHLRNLRAEYEEAIGKDENEVNFAISRLSAYNKNAEYRDEAAKREAAIKLLGDWFVRDKVAKYIKYEKIIKDFEDYLVKSEEASGEVPRFRPGQVTGILMSLDAMDLLEADEMERLKAWFMDCTVVQSWAKEDLGYYLPYPLLEDSIKTMREKSEGIPYIYTAMDRMRAKFRDMFKNDIGSFKYAGAEEETQKDNLWAERVVFGGLFDARSEMLAEALAGISDPKNPGDAVRIRGESIEHLNGFHNDIVYLLAKKDYADHTKEYAEDDEAVQEAAAFRRQKIDMFANNLDAIILPEILKTMTIRDSGSNGKSIIGLRERNKWWTYLNKKWLNDMFKSRRDTKKRWENDRKKYAQQVRNKEKREEALAYTLKEVKKALGEANKDLAGRPQPKGKKITITITDGLIWYFQKAMLASGNTAKELMQEAYLFPEDLRQVYREIYGREPTDLEEEKIKFYVIKMVQDGWTIDFIRTVLIYGEYIKWEMKTQLGKELNSVDTEILVNHMINSGFMPVDTALLGIPLEALIEKDEKARAEKVKDLPIHRAIAVMNKVAGDIKKAGYELDDNEVFYAVGMSLGINIAESPDEEKVMG